MPNDRATFTQTTALGRFALAMRQGDPLAALRAGLIGEGMDFDTPFGTKRMIYADYTASGRALRQVEEFVMTEILPIYANSHTEASHCGRAITRMREEARGIIARELNAGPGCHVIFAGNGATAGINRIVGLLRLRDRVAAGEDIRVLIGPYEHHSNILPWRESGAQVAEIPEAAEGGVDMDALAQALAQTKGADLVVGAFSAASNVTGLLTDVDAVTRALKAAGALAVWDYACAGPYVAMDMSPAPDAQKDAIVLSPHKFPGGPGASGLAVIRDTLVQTTRPTAPGGGTVSFVSPWDHIYSPRVEAREEAGTPNVIADIRAALALLVKAAVGTDTIHAREETLRARALDRLGALPGLDLMGAPEGRRGLPIFSFQIHGASGRVHHQLVTRMLSDHYGVQARGGCACAGPYAHRLMGLDAPASGALIARLAAGEELAKPGWTRLNLSYCHSDAQVEAILSALCDLAARADTLAQDYEACPVTARFHARPAA
ncbi:MAG: aminotransferase class V-fold PLP-dependent enzyme [Salipiger marinus]|uniref:aminotransferase class V-fold PLP-dependent enzyme n=1 Tax=Salipiger marinus TaxID=555512 RepID=UPI00405A4698